MTNGRATVLGELSALGRQRILVAYDRVPEADASGADLRIYQLVEILAAAGNEVVFIGRSPLPSARGRRALVELGVEVLAPDPERVFWEPCAAKPIELERLLAERDFDFALLYSYFWVGISVAEQYLEPIRRASPRTRILVLSDDCHWVREERRAERERSRTVLERARGLRAKELDLYARADLVLTITEEDRARMQAALPGLDPIVVAFGQEPIPDAVPGFAARAGLVFLGSGGNDANVRSIEWFVSEILPLVRAVLPSVELAVVGEPPRGGWCFAAEPGIRACGWVGDLAPVLARARVFVSPITYGTGLKTKNVQALGAGLPLVATPISAEGMHFTGDDPAFVRADARSFADAVVALHEDRALWEACSLGALAHARAWFGRERVIRDLAAALRAAAAIEPRLGESERIAPIAPGLLAESIFPERMAEKKLSARYAAHLDLARALRAQGFCAEAEQELRNVFCELCRSPSDSAVFAELHALLAPLYLARGAFEEAALAAEEAMRLAPKVGGGVERATMAS